MGGSAMRRLLMIGAVTVGLSCAAAAAEPTGEWRVEDGEANIRIDDCSGALWGIISWQKNPGNLDSYNPDPAERTRPTLGIAVLKAMRPTKPNLWEGEVYNAKNGRTYSARISLLSADMLKIEGCVLGGLICGGENWTRLPAPARGSRSACSGLPKR